MRNSIAFAGFILPAILSAQNGSQPPTFSLDATDVFEAFRLPPLKDQSDGPLASAITKLQVTARAQSLGLNGGSAAEAWLLAEQTVPQIRQLDRAVSGPVHNFVGSTASELNRFISTSPAGNIRVTNPTLTVDQPITIQRDDVTLDLGTAVLTRTSSDPYLIRVERCANVILQGGEFTGQGSAVLVNAASKVVIRRVFAHDLVGNGVVVTASDQVLVTDNRFDSLTGAGIILHRLTTSSLVQNNQILNGKGASNLTAGIVLTDREVDVTVDPASLFGPDGYWVVVQPLTIRTHPPINNIILNNHVWRNLASGIYSDGAARNVIAANRIELNGKEGLCLDNGSTANVVTSNLVQKNGQRWGESDDILAKDFIQAAGRMADGTATAKVPGISVDNAAYNIVFSNQVLHNYGGGIKCVRTCYFDVIGLNTLFSNNDGASSTYHYFGVELGGATADSSDPGLDFTPSRGNIVFSNPVRGNHSSGIYFAAGSDLNDVFDNVIMDSQNWALESVSEMQNNSLNNLTNLPSRNVSSGLVPWLATAQ